jgi:hypothetical protein
MIIDKTYALLSLRPTASFAVVNDEIQWFDTIQTQPTQSEINAEIIRLQDEYNAKQYQRNRAAEYPSIADQLDKIFHDGIDEWKETIQAVKDKYPKS